MSETRYPDIEIYLRGATTEGVMKWLQQEFPTAELKIRSRGDGSQRLELVSTISTIPVTLVRDAMPGYIIAWFDSGATPWDTDLDCARAASTYLSCEVRCSTGSWKEDDVEQWWRVHGERVEAIAWT